ncbi:S8 family serine peptidase [Sphingomonas sp. R1]|uniref:S8 family serine peptidase n=1 Tax=Sphingomonas sp. R1 TaxID=399176 RepID=UPI002223FF17|nr:S8 family serine peptidase [Sphingomonas sp. R1]UYY76787.1 S8 family serine peptidase [Sphingomonas sp. R1]
MRRLWHSIGLVPLFAASPALAQLIPSVPNLPTSLAPGQLLGRVDEALENGAGRVAQRLEAIRRDAAARLVRAYPDRIVLDPDGNLARAGEVVVDDPDAALLAAMHAKGYAVLAREDVLGVRYTRLAVPRGRTLGQAIRELRKLGAGNVTADQLHATSGNVPASPAPAAAGSGTVVGVIDGAVPGATLRAGFASGAPRDSDHATAVASLISGAGIVRGGLPGARIASADVYGTDPAGGNATAIARAIGWMVDNRVSVVTISLTGPANPVLGKVIAAAQARGTAIVAAVGNNGPAAPPAYPASYPGVVAVTGVDARGRVLIEAGRAGHLDYAAPGADMLAMAAGGRTMRVRGTSFAAPLVAATLARFYPAASAGQLQAAIAKVDAVARDAGARGPDPVFGRGIVCEACRTPAR